MQDTTTTMQRDISTSTAPTKTKRDMQHRSKSSHRAAAPTSARVRTAHDQDEHLERPRVRCHHKLISKLPPRSDEHSATLLTTANEKLCIASASAYPPRSIPSLANSASSPESEEISTQSRKRRRSDIEQDHLEQAQKRTHQQNKHLTAEHREEEHLVAAYLGTGHIEAGNTVADFQAE